MKNQLTMAVKTILAGTALSLASTGALAAGGVTPQAWTGNDNSVGLNETITTVTAGINKNSYTDNAVLNNSAWGHTGKWFNFQLTQLADVTIKSANVTGAAKNAFTVWASGSSPWDGGTLYAAETNGGTASGNAPHSFNVTGQLGSPGTYWMSSPSVVSPSAPDNIPGASNMLETLAYVNSGIAHSGNDWGENILAGVNQVSNTGNYFSGSTGTTGLSFAEMSLLGLKPGWYTLFVGGADSSQTAGTFNVAVTANASAVPLPAAVYLFGSALAGLVASGRNKQKAA